MKPPRKPQPKPHLELKPETLEYYISQITSRMRSQQPQFFSGQIIRSRQKAIKDTFDLVSAKHDLAALSE